MVKCHLYRMYDSADVLLYVGISANVYTRIPQHHARPWWDLVSRIDVQRLPDRRAAALAELEAIRTEHPIYNVAGRRGGSLAEPTWDQLVMECPALLGILDKLSALHAEHPAVTSSEVWCGTGVAASTFPGGVRDAINDLIGSGGPPSEREYESAAALTGYRDGDWTDPEREHIADATSDIADILASLRRRVPNHLRSFEWYVAASSALLGFIEEHFTTDEDVEHQGAE